MGNCFLYKRGGGSGGGGSAPPLTIITAMGEVIKLIDSVAKPLHGLTLYGKTTQDGTPSPDAPVALDSVGDGGNIGVTVCGKNLLKYPYAETTKTENGITFTDNGDGTITVNGTAAGNSHFRFETSNAPLDIPAGLTVTLSGCPSGGSTSTFRVQMNNGGSGVGDYGESKTFITAEGAVYGYIQIFSGFTANNLVFEPQLEIGTIATDYEPYKEPQTLTVPTPNGLPGIPVTSGGNYTDSTGQQWVCDEIDLGRGVYVQRIAKVVYDGSEFWNVVGTEAGTKAMRLMTLDPPAKPAVNNNKLEGTNIKSSEFITVPAGIGGVYSSVEGISVNTSGHLAIYWERYNTSDVSLWKAYLADYPMTVIYELATPIERPLTAEELADYASLSTYYPTTTVYNDAGAGMEVKYVSTGG